MLEDDERPPSFKLLGNCCFDDLSTYMDIMLVLSKEISFEEQIWSLPTYFRKSPNLA